VPATNEEFIKKAFEAGLTEDQVRQAVAERNLKMSSSPQTSTPVPTASSNQWSDLPGNILPSAGKNLGDIVSAVTHPIPTLYGLGSLIHGVTKKTEELPVVGGMIKSEHDRDPMYQIKNQAFPQANQTVDVLADFYKNRYGGVEQAKKTMINDPAGFMLDLSTFLSAGAGAAGKVGQVGKLGKVTQAAKVAGTVGETIDPIQAVLKMTGKTGSAIAKTGAKVAGKVEESAKELPLRGVRISPTQQVKFEETVGMPVVDFIEKYKLSANPVDKGIELAENTQKQFDDIALNSGRSVSAQDLAKAFDQRINDLTGGLNAYLPENVKLAQDLTARKGRFLQQMQETGNISVQDLTQIRRKTDDLVKPSQFLANPDVATANVQVRQILNDAIQGATADLKIGGKSLKELGQDLKGLYKFNEIVAKTTLPPAKSPFMNFLRLAYAGTSVAAGNVPALVGGYFAEKAIQNPGVLSAVSSGMRTGVNAGRVVGGATSNTFSALQRALENANTAARNSGVRMLPRVLNRPRSSEQF
jgi:hypothetical protein